MLFKITERCSMGCTHCMNRATPDGDDISVDTLLDVLKFLRDNNLGRILIISGGEPLEHHDFDSILKTLHDFSREFHCFDIVTVTTNGEQILKDPARFKGYIQDCSDSFQLVFQVSADTRYYPRRIPVHKRIFRERGFVLCDDCVEQIYPQGRALDNGIPWKAKASKCFNVRAISKQIPENSTLSDIEKILSFDMKFCTPSIDIHGNIKLGESDLCPVCASIYDSMDVIMKKIREFKCHGCDHINDTLPDLYKSFL